MDTRAIPFAVALCLPLLGTTHALADDAPLVVAMDDQAEFQSLLNILEEQTEIATKTKLNADYVPGMVTVLHGITLESGGVNSVWEALRRVPGFYTSRDRTGNLVAVVRGSGGLFASGLDRRIHRLPAATGCRQGLCGRRRHPSAARKTARRPPGC